MSGLTTACAVGTALAHATRRRLSVLAAGGTDVVRGAGGLLYDRATAGWDITVYLAESCDDRPFRILGVMAAPLDDANGVCADPQCPDAIMTSSMLYLENSAVRRYFAEALQNDYTETAIWGGQCPPDLSPGARIEYRLSAAARAFKSQALFACGLAAKPVESTEIFQSSKRRFAVAVPLL